MEAIQRNKYGFVVAILFLIFACNDVSEFNQYKTIEGNTWKANQNIDFQFEVKDTIKPKNLFINIRNNNDYAFSNLYLITQLEFPNNTKIIDTLQYKMADVNGRFLGDGFSEIKENKLFYKERKIFPVSGSYIFSVRQAMRKNGAINPIENLKGIQDVGFSIEKIK